MEVKGFLRLPFCAFQAPSRAARILLLLALLGHILPSQGPVRNADAARPPSDLRRPLSGSGARPKTTQTRSSGPPDPSQPFKGAPGPRRSGPSCRRYSSQFGGPEDGTGRPLSADCLGLGSLERARKLSKGIKKPSCSPPPPPSPKPSPHVALQSVPGSGGPSSDPPFPPAPDSESPRPSDWFTVALPPSGLRSKTPSPVRGTRAEVKSPAQKDGLGGFFQKLRNYLKAPGKTKGSRGHVVSASVEDLSAGAVGGAGAVGPLEGVPGAIHNLAGRTAGIGGTLPGRIRGPAPSKPPRPNMGRAVYFSSLYDETGPSGSESTESPYSTPADAVAGPQASKHHTYTDPYDSVGPTSPYYNLPEGFSSRRESTYENVPGDSQQDLSAAEEFIYYMPSGEEGVYAVPTEPGRRGSHVPWVAPGYVSPFQGRRAGGATGRVRARRRRQDELPAVPGGLTGDDAYVSLRAPSGPGAGASRGPRGDYTLLQLPGAHVPYAVTSPLVTGGLPLQGEEPVYEIPPDAHQVEHIYDTVPNDHDPPQPPPEDPVYYNVPDAAKGGRGGRQAR